MPLKGEGELDRLKASAADAIRQQAKRPLVAVQREFKLTPVNEMPDLIRKVKKSVEGELITRGFNITTWQRGNVRRLMRPERESDIESGASPEQVARLRRLNNIEPRPGSHHNRGRGYSDGNDHGDKQSRGPGGIRGRRSHINAGRPKGN